MAQICAAAIHAISICWQPSFSNAFERARMELPVVTTSSIIKTFRYLRLSALMTFNPT